MVRPGRESSSNADGVVAVARQTRHVSSRLEESSALDGVVRELQAIERQAGIERTLAIGELVLSRFFGGDPAMWRDRRRNKNNSIRRLAQRPDCPYCKSALTEAIAVYVAVRELNCVRTYGHISASHVAAVLRVERPEQARLLQQAEDGCWSVRELREQVVAFRRASGERRGRPRSSEGERALASLHQALTLLEKAIGELREVSFRSEAAAELRHARQQLDSWSKHLAALVGANPLGSDAGSGPQFADGAALALGASG